MNRLLLPLVLCPVLAAAQVGPGRLELPAAGASQAAFAAGQLDALSVLDANRAWLQVRLERIRALTRLLAAVVDLERAAGAWEAP